MLAEQRRFEESAQALERAIALDPRDADAHYLMGQACQRRDRLEEAAKHFGAALERRSDFVEARHALGVALRLLGKLDDALSCFDRVLSQRPDFAESRFNMALILLLRGDLARGFELFESRLEARRSPQIEAWLTRVAKQPGLKRWRGEELGGKRLLVWTEEGAGDCLMMMRYLPLLAAKGGREIAVLCDPSLARLCQQLPNVASASSAVESLPLRAFDFHCSIMSMPALFATRADSIPDAVPYLQVPHELQERWRGRLAALPGLRAGLVWAGSRDYGRDFLRSVRPRQLAPLLGVSGVSFVSLQKGVAPEERRELPGSLADWMDECRDFMDTASLVLNLDLVISVDTSVAHLAGALGKPVWLFNRSESEWRWQLGREDSPWYPTLRIFTQSVPGDWDGVARRMAAALARLAQSRPGP